MVPWKCVWHNKIKDGKREKMSDTPVFIFQAFCMAAIPAAHAKRFCSCCHWLCNTTPEPWAPLRRGSALPLYWNTQLPRLHLILTPQSPAFTSMPIISLGSSAQQQIDSFHLTPDTSRTTTHTAHIPAAEMQYSHFPIPDSGRKNLLILHWRD